MISRNLRSLAQIHASLAARALLNTDNVHAEWAGTDILAVFQCEQVNYTAVYENGVYKGECFDSIPVLITDGTLMFKEQGTSNLVKNARKIDCEKKFTFVRKINGEYHSDLGKQEVITINYSPLHTEEVARHVTFDAPTLSVDSIEFQAEVISLRSLAYQNQLSADQLKALTAFTAYFDINPQQTADKLSNFAHTITKEGTQLLETVADSITDSTANLITRTARKMLAGNWQSAANACVWIGVIGACLVITYRLYTCAILRKCIKCVSHKKQLRAKSIKNPKMKSVPKRITSVFNTPRTRSDLELNTREIEEGHTPATHNTKVYFPPTGGLFNTTTKLFKEEVTEHMLMLQTVESSNRFVNNDDFDYTFDNATVINCAHASDVDTHIAPSKHTLRTLGTFIIAILLGTITAYLNALTEINASTGKSFTASVPAIIKDSNGHMRKIASLFDTGCSTSAISVSATFKLGLTHLIKKCNIRAEGCSGKELKVIGLLTTSVLFGPIILKNMTLHVIDSSSQFDLLIGGEIQSCLGRYEVKMHNVGYGYIHTNGHDIPYGRDFPFNSMHAETRIFNSYTIEAHSTHQIQVYTQGIGHNKLTIFEPKEQFLCETKLNICDQFVEFTNSNICTVLIHNPTNNRIKLYKNTRIGTVDHINLTNFGRTTNEINAHLMAAQSRDRKRQYTKEEIEAIIKQIIPNLDKQTHLSGEQKEQIDAIVRKRHRCFARFETDIGVCDKVKHEIFTGAAPPQKGRLIYLGPKANEEMNRQVEGLLHAGFIQHSTSGWRASAFLVKRKGENATPRLVCDFRAVNSVSTLPASPLPLAQSLLDQVGKARYFSSLDLQSGYHQQLMHENSIEKTCFVTTAGAFEWLRTPMGLCGAGGSFCRLLSAVMQGIPGVVCYLDDLLIYSETWEEHIEHLDKCLEALENANLVCGPLKAKFASILIDFIGFEISKEGIRPTKAKTEAIRNWKTPTKIVEVQSFLGVTNFFRRHCPAFAPILTPLYTMLKKNTNESKNCTFQWSTEAQASFELIKDILCTRPLLQHPDWSRQMYIMSDASDHGIGGMVGQTRTGDIKDLLPVAYCSRLLSETEKRYPVIEREVLAIYYCVRQFRPMIYQHPTTVLTDHQPLCWLDRLKADPHGRLSRWAMALTDDLLDYKHVAGISNPVADALSRLPGAREGPEDDPTEMFYSKSNTQTDINEETFDDSYDASNNQLSEWARLQVDDEVLSPMVKFLTDGSLPDNDEHARKILLEHSAYQLIDGALYRIDKQKDRLLVLVVPTRMIVDLLKQFHDAPTAGHPGPERQYRRMSERFYWTNMLKAIIEYCAKCEVCCKVKTRGRAVQPYTKSMPIVTRPWMRVVCDAIGPFNVSQNGNRYVITYIDQLTKYPITVALPTLQAEIVAKSFVDKVVFEHGMALMIRCSDRGTCFTSKLMEEVDRILSVRRQFSTSYHPQSQGVVEKFNSLLKQGLRSYAHTLDMQDRWDEALPALTFAYRTTYHATIRTTPFEALHGYTAILPADCPLYAQRAHAQTTLADYVSRLKKDLGDAWTLASQYWADAQNSQDARLNDHSKPNQVQVGDVVYIDVRAKPYGIPAGLAPKWNGPYRAIGVFGPNVQITPIGKQSPVRVVHAARLKIVRLEEETEEAKALDVSPQIVETAAMSSEDEAYEDTVMNEHDRMALVNVERDGPVATRTRQHDKEIT
jgi:hypothetical protein